MKQNQKFGMFMTIIISMIMAWLPSCSKDGEDNQAITHIPWNLSVIDSQGDIIAKYDSGWDDKDICTEWDVQDIRLTIDSNKDWVVIKHDGFVVNPVEGKAGTSLITLHQEKNTKYDITKEIEIESTSDGPHLRKSIFIDHKGYLFIKASPDFFPFAITNNMTVTADVNSNIDSLKVTNPKWLKVSLGAKKYYQDGSYFRYIYITCIEQTLEKRQDYVEISSLDDEIYDCISIHQDPN